jgi:hypothetical protein
MPPTKSQEESVVTITRALSQTDEKFFIIIFGYLCKSFAARAISDWRAGSYLFARK